MYVGLRVDGWIYTVPIKLVSIFYRKRRKIYFAQEHYKHVINAINDY